MSDPLHALHHISVRRLLRQSFFRTVFQCPIQCLFHPLCPLFFRHMEPAILTFLHRIGEIFQRIMKDISHVHSLKAIGLPLLKPQSILQKMCIRAGCKLFQSGDTSFQKGSIECSGRRLSNRIFLSSVKDCIHKTFQLLLPARLPCIPVKQRFLLRGRLPFPGRLQCFRQLRNASRRYRQTVQKTPVSVGADLHFGKQFLHGRNEIGRPQCIAVRIRQTPGEMQFLRRNRQAHIHIKFLNAGLLSGRRCQFHFLGCQNFPIHLREQTAPALFLRHISFIDSGKEQHLDILQTASLHITDHHLVGARRNKSHFQFRKSCIQKLCVFFQGHDAVSQQHDQLVQKFHDHAVNLIVFFGQA